MPSLEELRQRHREKTAATKTADIPATAATTERVVHTVDTATGDHTETPIKKFQTNRWYDLVSRDVSLLQQAMDFYASAANDAEPHITATGHLQTMVAETPGLEFFYRNIFTDAQQIRRLLEERLEMETARKHKWFMISPEAKKEYGELKTTEAAKFTKADDAIIKLTEQVRLAAYWDHMLENVLNGFQSRSIMLSHIVKIREGGLQEVFINPGETPNR